MNPKKIALFVGAKLALLALVAGTVVMMMGCNTMEGMGKDVKAGGQAIERAADSAK